MSSLNITMQEAIDKIKQLELLNTKLEEETKKQRKYVKKSYEKYYLKNKTELTEEEKKTQQERIQKRRDYMNNRYQTIYKERRLKDKEQLTT